MHTPFDEGRSWLSELIASPSGVQNDSLLSQRIFHYSSTPIQLVCHKQSFAGLSWSPILLGHCWTVLLNSPSLLLVSCRSIKPKGYGGFGGLSKPFPYHFLHTNTEINPAIPHIYMYIYISYIHKKIHTCMWACEHIYIYIYISYIHKKIHTCMWACEQTHTLLSALTSKLQHICKYLRTYFSLYTRKHTHARMHQ